MNKKRVWLLAAVLILAVLLLSHWMHRKAAPTLEQETVATSASPSHLPLPVPTALPSNPASSHQLPQGNANLVQGQEAVAAERKVFDMLFMTPINFYGKVIDEKGNPIPGANVNLSFADSMMSNDTKLNETTDAGGLFHVSGHGLGIVVMVSKKGYYHLQKSDGNFGYANIGGAVDTHPDPDNPAIFVLRKMGQAVPLIRLQKYIRIKKDGTPIELNLATGQLAAGGQDDIEVQAWTYDQGLQPNSNTPYNWRCSISVPGGGLVARTGEFDFEAPAGNYVSSDEIDMPASAGSQWRSEVSRQYFVLLADGRFARITFQMVAGGDHFFAIGSFLNPVPGDRNLEFDPDQAIKP